MTVDPRVLADSDGLDRLWAKSPLRGAPLGTAGETLTSHLSATLRALAAVRERIGSVAVLPEGFWIAAAWAALSHDAGKVASGFQQQLGNGGNQTTWGQRHEVLSLGFLPVLLGGLPEDLRALVTVGIATHHRALHADLTASGNKPSLSTLYGGVDVGSFGAGFGHIDADAAAQLARWLVRTAREAGLPSPHDEPRPTDLVHAAHDELATLLDEWEEVEPAQGLVGILVQGAVTLADHLSSAHGDIDLRQPLGTAYRTSLVDRLARAGSRLRPHQLAAEAVDGHLLLRSPTGSGKTEAALLWSAAAIGHIRSRTSAEPRLFYTLPYLASINAMAQRLGRELGDPDVIGISHSRAASYHLANSTGDDGTDKERARKAASRARATRLFREPIRVGTPYQLLRGALAGPSHSSVLLDSTNSVFVLDELHAYDPRRLGMILAALEFWAKLGGRVAVLSATLPNALVGLVRTSLDLPKDHHPVEPDANVWPNRHRLRLDHEYLTHADSLAAIRALIRDGRSVLVVANNVRNAQAVHSSLAAEVEELHGPGSCGLLHSRFRRFDRSRIEQAIMDRYGNGKRHRAGLLVATQTVEVSLDVDFDTIHTSAAPLEPLLQRFGRVNRTMSRPPADVVVHAPEYSTARGGRADGVYDAELTRLTWDILSAHDGQVIDERGVTGWLDTIYDSSWGARWYAEVDAVRTEFRDRFLTFGMPFLDRSDFQEKFDELFDGTEAILASDRESYQEALDDAGRLFADGYLIPLPRHAMGSARWDRGLHVRMIDAEYSPVNGLGEITRDDRPLYDAGTVF